jgi:multimeric flavodoxin WrbA
MTNVAVIYYSATGNVHALAEAVAEGAAEAGAQVRLRRVAELAPAEAIASRPEWQAHVDAVVAPGYTDESILLAGGNPYGTSHAAETGLPGSETLAAARHQGRRLAAIAELIGSGERLERLAA